MSANYGTYLSRRPSTKTADYTATVDDDIIAVDTTSAAVTITLYSASGKFPGSSAPGGVVRVVKVNSGGYAVTIAASGSETITGNAELRDKNQSAVFESDGIATWYNFQPTQKKFRAVVALSSANILAMNGAPVSLLPAPGAGKIIVVERVSLKMTTTATQYANGGAVEIRYTDASGAKVIADIAAAVITAAAGTSYTTNGGIVTSLTAVVNAAIVATNATAPFITGTGAGVLVIDYRVEDFA